MGTSGPCSHKDAGEPNNGRVAGASPQPPEQELLRQVTEGLNYAVLKLKEQCEEECDGYWISSISSLIHCLYMLDMLFSSICFPGKAVFYSLYFIYDDYIINYFIHTGVWCRDVRLHATVK